ncbi:phosphomevalonate kinase [Galendromus occidentalis]|uniref:Phosphomevalonate kinase n=1 Tax=Galendromus occidentalis TaxID=34638 RepID=A0AAJ6QU12_9ACAR|nr:phosphomevalonate kinase [Galendromus occidentalis]
MTAPKLVLVFSGKRKSGKDHLTDVLLRSAPESSAVIIRLSGPLKEAYAKEHGLDFSRLLDASEYKEKYRSDMVAWGEKQRQINPAFFCELAVEKYQADKVPIWIVSDARRPTDIEYFVKKFPGRTALCRIVADDSVRRQRGWEYVSGVDDQETECALDEYISWDIILNNDGEMPLEKLLKPCLDLIRQAVE